MDQRPRCKHENGKILKGSTSVNPCDLGLSNGFLNITSKHKHFLRKILIKTSLKLKYFLYQRSL